MATVNVTAVTNFVAEKIFELNVGMNPLINSANRFYVDQFDTALPYAPGRSVDIKVPGYPAVTTGISTTPDAIVDLVLPYLITVDDIYNVTYQVDNFSMKFDFKGGAGALTDPQKQNIVDAYALPAYVSMSQKQENVAAFRMKTNAMYTPIDTIDKLTGINNFSGVSQVSEFMDNLQYATDERYFMMNLKDGYAVSNSLQNSFNEKLNENVSDSGWIGGSSLNSNLAGLQVKKSKNLTKHTAGPLAGRAGMTVTAISADGTVVTLSGVPSVTTKLVNAGDYFSIESVQLISTVDKVVFDKKLVIKANIDANGDGAGNVQVTLPYPLMASGTHANVDSLPANGAPVIAYPNRNLNFAYVPSGLSVVPLSLGDIFGASNSESKVDMTKCPINTYMQGAVLDLANIFRISQLIGIRAFTPYMIEVPSAAA